MIQKTEIREPFNTPFPYLRLLTINDVCSRWAIARPVSNIQHQEMARLIMEEWAKVGVHIVPKKVTHDGGGECKARFEDMCHLLKKERHVAINSRVT